MKARDSEVWRQDYSSVVAARSEGRTGAEGLSVLTRIAVVATQAGPRRAVDAHGPAWGPNTIRAVPPAAADEKPCRHGSRENRRAGMHVLHRTRRSHAPRLRIVFRRCKPHKRGEVPERPSTRRSSACAGPLVCRALPTARGPPKTRTCSRLASEWEAGAEAEAFLRVARVFRFSRASGSCCAKEAGRDDGTEIRSRGDRG